MTFFKGLYSVIQAHMAEKTHWELGKLGTLREGSGN